MTEEVQRVAIAEACGWTHMRQIADCDPDTMRMSLLVGSKRNEKYDECEVPNYPHSLDAMHEAEKVLNTEHKRAAYLTLLEKICFVPRNGITYEDFLMGVGWEHQEHVFATAAQRAEAFLRTLNLWDDTK